MTFFSVIIPLYNKESFIENTIKSVLDQSFHDFEIIIVDDGSTDNSAVIVSQIKDTRIKLLKQKNLGVSQARNIAIRKAKSKFIALLDADDSWFNNHLFELKKQIDLFPDAGLYCNNYEIYLNPKNKRPAHFNLKFDKDCLIVNDYFKASIINPIAWTSAVCFSKEHFIKIGEFNTYLKTAQDIDLWIRFALKHKVCFNPTITMTYKLYVENSLSKNEYNVIRYDFINSYNKEEKNNPSLKLYLDINRYAVALRCKTNNEKKLYRKLKGEIDCKNLNIKQKLLINTPAFGLKLIKRFQRFLIDRKIYLTAFK